MKNRAIRTLIDLNLATRISPQIPESSDSDSQFGLEDTFDVRPNIYD